MIVYDSGQFFWNWDVQVDRAWTWTRRRWRRRAGRVYHHNSFRGLSPAVLERHFVKQGGGPRR